MEYTYSDWIQIKVTVKTPFLDRVVAIMSVVDVNLMIEDYSDFNLKSVYGDLVDETILNADKTIASVSVFLAADADAAGTVAYLRDRLSAEAIEAAVDVATVNEADWANTWRQYYKPLHIGSVVICPKWEKYDPAEGETLVVMDPGMAFGTGSHETTKNVIAMLQEYVTDGCSVLDVGTGSGILAIAAKKLGAGLTRAYDIDRIAVEVAAENAKYNGVGDIECGVSDLLAGVAAGQYDVICANIVADIIIRMAPDIGRFMSATSTCLCSGIITERAEEVVEALEANGLYIAETREDNGWCALAVKKLV